MAETRLGENNANFGKKWSEEQKLVISKVNTGRIGANRGKTFEEIHGDIRAKEIKQKLSTFHKGNKYSHGVRHKEESKQKNVCSGHNKNH